MSHVLSVTLICSIMETDPGEERGEGPSAVGFVNEQLDSARGGPVGWKLSRVDGHAGGSKAVQYSIWAGGLNYCPPSLLREIVAAAPWQEPGAVVLVIEDEDDDAPTVVRKETGW